MAVSVRIPNGPLYVDMDGFRLSKNFTLEHFRSALKYQPGPNDKFVVTFPKCGTTWTQHIGYLIFSKGVPPSSGLEFLRRSPFLEMFGAETVAQMERPGVIKTHLPYNMVPQHPEAKYVYVCRNPKDACVSFFYHTRGFSGYDFTDGKFDDFFQVFLGGKTDYGDYFEHVLSWHAHRNDPNVLFIHYEDMKANPREYVLKIAEFLDKEYYKLLLGNEEILGKIVEFSDIKSMQVHASENFHNFFTKPLESHDVPDGLKTFHEASQRQPSSAKFIRKGIVGDWKLHFTPEMNEQMNQKIHKTLSDTDIIDVWKKHGVM